ncbi:hypothetical protein COO60DRAFT_196269 [Scenedesmus sp. NREL 46B-D3]|nr:hypothetical protein COO60DRAFT_196269 [Scenedesmus sp. NREL 46B-D3]
MHKGFLARLLGLGRHGLRAVNCSRSLCHSSSASPCQTASHVASPAPAEAPKQLPGPPHGRRYLPAAIGAQLPPQLLPAAATSVTDLQRQGCVSITVQCSPTAAGTQILVINGAGSGSSSTTTTTTTTRSFPAALTVQRMQPQQAPGPHCPLGCLALLAAARQRAQWLTTT